MNDGRTVFSQGPIYRVDFSRDLSCWDQYLAMAFAQLTYRESLRDIEVCLRSVGGKCFDRDRSTALCPRSNRGRPGSELICYDEGIGHLRKLLELDPSFRDGIPRQGSTFDVGRCERITQLEDVRPRDGFSQNGSRLRFSALRPTLPRPAAPNGRLAVKSACEYYHLVL